MNTTICFTGHRKIGGVYEGQPHEAVKLALINECRTAIELGYTQFISGGALGVDMLGAEAVLFLKQTEYHDVELVMALPHRGYNSRWYESSKKRLNTICQYATVITLHDAVTHPIFKIWMLFKRNEWMVDNSFSVISVWDGVPKGGTYNCVKYAIENAKSILNIHPDTLVRSEIVLDHIKG